MKAQEFYVKLKALSTKGYHVSRTTKNNPAGEIRLARKDMHKSFDPITAVAHAISGKYFQVQNYDKANRYLKLHSDTLESLAAASDNAGSPVVRKRLCSALGL